MIKSYKILKWENELYKEVISRQNETLKKCNLIVKDLKNENKELRAKVIKYENNYNN